MQKILIAAVLLSVVFQAGCSSESRSPDAVREQTANVTAAAKRNAKAVAQGVFEGLKRKGPVNINKASKEDLMALPGVTEATANAIVAGRPYTSGAQLVRRRIVSKAQYGKISDKIVAK